MSGQQRSSIGDGVLVRVEVALRRREGAMPSDLAQMVNRNAGVGHPGQARVAQIVAAEVFVAE